MVPGISFYGILHFVAVENLEDEIVNRKENKPMILEGDCIELMKEFDENTFDAIVTDPPYNLHFMGKDWDKDLLHEKWLVEAYRILKPGASILIMGGTRTFHRLMVAIEDTGFIIKDTLMWIYGSGFPKAHDLGKMIDKRMGREREIIGSKLGLPGYSLNPNLGNGVAMSGNVDKSLRNPEKECEITIPATDLAKHWDGFKIGGIKPAYEPIVWAVKPPEGNYIDNVLKWGVGAVNVDECRIEANEKLVRPAIQREKDEAIFPLGAGIQIEPKGRFPANIILDEEAGRMLDEQTKDLKPPWGKGKSISKTKSWKQSNEERLIDNSQYRDSGGASRFFYCAKASRGERNKGLDELVDVEVKGQPSWLSEKGVHNETGKPNKPIITKNDHPTVKPIKLFEYLIKLVTRKGQIILDPFFGSGTTMIAANNVGRECVGIEKEREYIEIAEKRVEYWLKEIGKYVSKKESE